ncbi:hypothetical protein [Nocardia sp. NPDC004711]
MKAATPVRAMEMISQGLPKTCIRLAVRESEHRNSDCDLRVDAADPVQDSHTREGLIAWG